MNDKPISNHCWNILVFIRDNVKNDEVRLRCDSLLRGLNTASGKRLMPEARAYCIELGFKPED